MFLDADNGGGVGNGTNGGAAGGTEGTEGAEGSGEKTYATFFKNNDFMQTP